MSEDAINSHGPAGAEPGRQTTGPAGPEPDSGGGGSPGPERRRSRSGGPGEPPPPLATGSACGPEEGVDLGELARLGLPEPPDDPVPARLPRLGGRSRRRRLVTPEQATPLALTPQQRLLLLDTWKRSGLPAGDFAALVGLSKHTLYSWQKRFAAQGPAGLMDRPRGQRPGCRLPELTRRTILMLEQANPDWGCQRISDLLLRGPALPASPAAVARVLHEAGYQLEENPTRPHEPPVRHFERARPNQLWQTDLFTFILKRQNRRVYLVAFLDDHSRFVVGYGLHASQSAALVLEVLRVSLTASGTPAEILTDNGAQYVTWRGTSAFSKELDKRGIRQIVATPRRPQTLGKIERFWGSLWRECVASAVFVDLEDARRRIGLYIDHYNFARPHQGIDGLTPADRYFGAAEEVKRTLQARVAANALELARHGLPKAPFYLTGQVGGQGFSVHAEGERVILTGAGGARREVELTPPPTVASAPTWPEPICPGATVATFAGAGAEEPAGPGESPLDEGLTRLQQELSEPQGGEA
jgi:transposase InsO family protein